MASWVSVQLDTTPPSFDVDVPDVQPGTTLVVPYTLSDGDISGLLTLPDASTVTGSIVGDHFEFVVPGDAYGLGTIEFIAIDDVWNTSEREEDTFIGDPPPVTRHPLDLVLLSGRTSSIVVADTSHDVDVIDNSTGTVVDETSTDVVADQTNTGVEITGPVHRVEVDEVVHGTVVLEMDHDALEDETDTGVLLGQVSTDAVVEEHVRGVVLLDDGHLTSVLTTISQKTVVEIPKVTDVVLIENPTAVIVNETRTGVIEP